MKHINLNQLELVELKHNEMTEVEGGNSFWNLISVAWYNTPNGGSSFWTNGGNGYFYGGHCGPEAGHCCTLAIRIR